MEKDWSDEKYLREAKREPIRLSFWRRYSHTELEAAKSVCRNSPWIDRMWVNIFPDAEKYKKGWKEIQ